MAFRFSNKMMHKQKAKPGFHGLATEDLLRAFEKRVRPMAQPRLKQRGKDRKALMHERIPFVGEFVH